MSHSNFNTSGWLNKTGTSRRFPRQARRNVYYDDEEDECCVIAEVIRKKIEEPSSTAVREDEGASQDRTPTTDDISSPSSSFHYQASQRRDEDDQFSPSSSFHSQGSQGNDEQNVFSPSSAFHSQACQMKGFKKNTEHLEGTSNSDRDLPTKGPNKSNKFFSTQRTSLTQSKANKSKMVFKNQMKKNLNNIQENYRLTEKYQYVQMLQSHTSSDSPVASTSTQHQREETESENIPIIDLTEDEPDEPSNTTPKPNLPSARGRPSEEEDVEFVQEVNEAKPGQGARRVRPDIISQGVHKMLRRHGGSYINIPVIDLLDDTILLSDAENEYEHEEDDDVVYDDDEDKQRKSYSEILEERLKKFMQITDPSKQQVEEFLDVPYLPELTPKQEKKVEEALKPGYRQEVLVRRFGLRIKKCDMETLKEHNWLNDEIINCYMNLIMERSKRNKNLPKVYAFNTYFYPSLLSRGYTRLSRWTRKVDIFSFDVLIVPVHLHMHWCLSAIDFRWKSIKYFDSVGMPNDRCLSTLLSYLKDESWDKKEKNFPVSEWETLNVDDIPQQMNGSDCGVFACTFAEHIARGYPFLFSQDNVPYLRKKIAVEVLEGKLLT